MSEESEAPVVTSEMTHLLREVRKHAFPPKEKTFFSIEGIIGYYENPTSKLLGFFMSPNAGHDLGPLFLKAFFACLRNKDCNDLSLQDARISLEVRTEDRKLIDMLVSGSDWVLVIENKIRHWLANPLDSYERHAKRNRNVRKLFFAIRSPDGKADAERPCWKPVSYQQYCEALRTEFAKAVFARPNSKWQVFAWEFIVHLENELYNPAMKMTPEQTAFVEENLREIAAIKELSFCHTANLRKELKERLETAIPGQGPFEFSEVLYGNGMDFALSCPKSLGNLSLHLWFQTPTHEAGNPERAYLIAVHVMGLTDAQRERAPDLSERAYPVAEGGLSVGDSQFKSRANAVDGLCKLAKAMFDTWGTDAPASPQGQA